MVVDPIGWPRFGAVVDLAGQPCFLAVGLGMADGLAIGGAVLTGSDVAFGFLDCFCDRR